MTDFEDIKSLAERSFGSAFIPQEDRVFAIALDGMCVSFAGIPGEPAMTLVRTRVVDTAKIERRGSLAVAALEGNLFWSGTACATLSLGADGWLWLTGRTPTEWLANPDGLAACVSRFMSTAVAWQERSSLHG